MRQLVYNKNEVFTHSSKVIIIINNKWELVRSLLCLHCKWELSIMQDGHQQPLQTIFRVRMGWGVFTLWQMSTDFIFRVVHTLFEQRELPTQGVQTIEQIMFKDSLQTKAIAYTTYT